MGYSRFEAVMALKLLTLVYVVTLMTLKNDYDKAIPENKDVLYSDTFKGDSSLAEAFDTFCNAFSSNST
jgi:hypothetical protein